MCEWISPWNSPWQLAIAEGFAEANSVFIVITLAKTLLRWLFRSKIYIQFTVFNTYFLTKLLCTNKKYHLQVLEKYLYVLQEVRYIIHFRQFIHPLSLHSHGNGTSSAKFCGITFLNNFILFHSFTICSSAGAKEK